MSMEIAALLKVSAIVESVAASAAVVKISNFVSIKLSYSRPDHYKIWKAGMLNFIEGQELLHIINAEQSSWVDESVVEVVDVISKIDNIVKSWILLTLENTLVEVVEDLNTAREVWMKLESIFNPSTTDTEQGDPAQKQKNEYLGALSVTVSEFVTVKISGRRNYYIWKAEMLYLVERQKLLHIIDSEYPFPEDKGVHMISKYDKLVKGWIYSTMEEQLLKDFIDYSSVQSIWRELESRFNLPISNREGDTVDASALIEDRIYIQASTVNVSNFVSVKLSGHDNYPIWRTQMMCLLNSQELLHIIKVEDPVLEHIHGHLTKRYGNLVKGWIVGTMNDQLVLTFSEYYPAQMLWKTLESRFSSVESDKAKEGGDLSRFKFKRESASEVPEMENTDSIRLKNKLYDAAVEGFWWKAKSILKRRKEAATEAITENGNTILHLATQMGHNYFVEKLLDFIKVGEHIEKKNNMGQTALHIAGMIGNECAAQLLVQKRKQLLLILDDDKRSPVDHAYRNMKINVYKYLLKCLLSSDLSQYPDGHQQNAIKTSIYSKQYDLARKMLKKFPEAATNDGGILKLITISFPTDLGFMESVIYPSYHDVLKKIFERCSLLLHSKFLDKCEEDIIRILKICNYTCCGWLGKSYMIFFVPVATLYTIYQLICFLIPVLRLPFSMLYFLVWNVFAFTVPPIKNIEKKKKEYKEAKKTLRLICKQMGTSDYYYRESIIEAVRQDTYEVVDEILFMSPSSIDYIDDEGYNIVQLVMINRSEKVYNLMHHIIEHYRRMEDFSNNKFLHLVGRLAPSFVLSRTTGAALQLQRELIWQEEVKKLYLPLELLDENIHKETPTQVFTREHQDLLKQGESWIKTTAESSSITAALIVTIVFAAAITVPGGSQQSGIPVLEKESAFIVFAVFNALSLFTATTALLLFLSILTTRFSERDFLVNLPRRLILALLMLFLSTTAMIVAFCAILFLVFCDQRPWLLAPICVFACLPISVLVSIKAPLLVDLIRSTYFPIFGNKSYLESCKINRRNTIFMESDRNW